MSLSIKFAYDVIFHIHNKGAKANDAGGVPCGRLLRTITHSMCSMILKLVVRTIVSCAYWCVCSQPSRNVCLCVLTITVGTVVMGAGDINFNIYG